MTVKELYGCASRALGGIVAKHLSFGLNFASFTKLFKSMVAPIMNYGSCIWGFKDYEKCSVLEHRAMRTFLGTGKYTAIPTLFGEMGWYPSDIDQKLSMVNYYVRLKYMDDDRLTKHIFLWDQERCVNNWSKEVKTILGICELGNMFTVGNLFRSKKWIIDKCCDKLKNQFKESWLNDVNTMPKLRTYKLLKTSFGTENYVASNINRDSKSTICRFRNGTFPLRIELGRYRKQPLNERLCTKCNNAQIESEFHFLMDCPLYDDERTVFFNSVSYENNLDKIDNFVHILKNADDHSMTLANHLNECLNKRNAS